MTATLPSATRAAAPSPDPTLPALRPHLSAYDTADFVRPVQRFCWQPASVQAHPADAAGLLGRTLLLLGGHRGLRAALADRLEGLGASVHLFEPAGTGHLPPPADIDALIDLNVVGLPFSAEPDCRPLWQAALTETTLAVQHVYDAWLADDRVDAHAFLVLTAMGGRHGYPAASPQRVSQPLGGIWSGLAKGLPRELPNLAVKILDLDQPALSEDGEADIAAAATRLGTALAAEYGRWDYYEVGLAEGTRVALAAVERDEPEQRVTIDAEDLVLVSGGARGVGFALVRQLATSCGCEVVVTGRKPLPTGPDRDRLVDDAAFQQWRRERRAGIRDAASARRIRAELAQADNDRAVLTNLAEAARAGLRIRYEACDVADAEQVLALFRRLPLTPTVIVHNAGIDEPARFSAKSVDIVLRTVDVKVSGFAALARAARLTADPARALKVFCNCGSLAGRMGGMIGQVDYAAGNEALARLGFWAREAGLPTQTLCWPTWERLGVIANYDAAVRYVSTISPSEGASRWLAELQGGHTDEVVFLGQIGTALVPSQLRGFRLFSGHHDLARLHSLYRYLGQPQRFTPFAQLSTRHHFSAQTAPYLGAVQVDGRVVLPPSLALELLISAADWVVPAGWPLQDLVALEDVTLDLAALTLPAGGEWRLLREATGAGTAARWEVRVCLRSIGVDGSPGPSAASATVVLSDQAEPFTVAQQPVPLQRPVGSTITGAGRITHSAPVSLPSQFEGSTPAGFDVPGISPAELWTTLYPPGQTIAVSALELLLVQTLPADGRPVLRLDTLLVRPGAQRLDRLLRTSQGWLGTTRTEGRDLAVLQTMSTGAPR